MSLFMHIETILNIYYYFSALILIFDEKNNMNLRIFRRGAMVAKSRAEIQRAYRQRLKEKNNEEYLEKERQRNRKSYVPSSQLTRRDRMRRNMRVNSNLKRHRKKMKQAKEAAAVQAPLTVKFSFSKAKAGKKRVSRALGRNIKMVKKLKEDLRQLQVKHKSNMRRMQRLKKKQQKKQSEEQEMPSTPRSKTKAQLEAANIGREQAKKIKKQVLLGNVLLDEVVDAKNANRKKSNVLHKIIAGKVLKKYRCLSAVNKRTGLSRRALSKSSSKCFTDKKEFRRRTVQMYQDSVTAFLERDDNSRNLPGKSDKVRMEDGSTSQKRVLTDYISNLHDKFLSENPTAVISLTSFQRIRPKYILTTSFISRSSCLCTKHQNAALLLKTLQKNGMDVPKNPEEFVNLPLPVDEMEEQLRDEITYSEWKRVAVEETNGQKKMVTKIVEVKKDKRAFIDYVQLQFQAFNEHVVRMKRQYKEIRNIKQNLPPHHHVIHMDFSENYNCKSMEEVQSAYWCQNFVTLHPTVIYSGLENAGEEEANQQAKHSSFVYISDELQHNASTVITFVKDLVEKVKEIDPQAETIHYWTDGPTSQYRNKTMFFLVANHKEMFGLNAHWNFFEAGHGKGPCDGIGGVTKRSADLAMKAGKCIIQSASDFHAWTQSTACNLRNIKFEYITKENCEATAEEIKTWPTKPIKGTMKLHAVIGRGEGKVLVNEVSCYCNSCMHGDMCPGWREENAQEPEKQNAVDEAPEREEREEREERQEEDVLEVNTDDFVAAVYEGQLYLGKVLEVDLADEYCYRITFLQKKFSQYQWPRSEDILWVKKDAVKFLIMDPIPSGRSKRLLKIHPEDRKKVERFDDY